MNYGAAGRVFVLVVFVTLLTPFAVLALFLPVPLTFPAAMLPEAFLNGFWVPGCVTVVVHIAPGYMRVSAVGLFLFLATVVGKSLIIVFSQPECSLKSQEL